MPRNCRRQWSWTSTKRSSTTRTYQARLIRDNAVYATPSWDAWVAEARATAVPGAVEFSKYAASKGVAVFYVSNRTANLEEATRKNLAAVGFPLPDGVDTVLVRGERPEWSASAKGPRRTFIATNYRIVMLIGDDLGDFVVDAAGTPTERSARASAQSDWWGTPLDHDSEPYLRFVGACHPRQRQGSDRGTPRRAEVSASTCCEEISQFPTSNFQVPTEVWKLGTGSYL